MPVPRKLPMKSRFLLKLFCWGWGFFWANCSDPLCPQIMASFFLESSNPHLHFGFRNYTLVSFAHIFRCSNWIFIQTLWIQTWGEVPVPSTRAQAIVSNDQKFFKIPKFRGLEITRSASFAAQQPCLESYERVGCGATAIFQEVSSRIYIKLTQLACWSWFIELVMIVRKSVI